MLQRGRLPRRNAQIMEEHVAATERNAEAAFHDRKLGARCNLTYARFGRHSSAGCLCCYACKSLLLTVRQEKRLTSEWLSLFSTVPTATSAYTQDCERRNNRERRLGHVDV
jgi:hypothetical protein